MTLIVGPLCYSKPCTLSFFFPEKMLFFKTASVLGTYLQNSQWSKVQLHVGKLYYFVRQERVIPFYAFSYT